MKVIDLLNKIANGEIDNKVKFATFTDYCDIDTFSSRYPLNEEFLNEKVNMVEEITEDKKIEKLESYVDEEGYLKVEGFEDNREQILQIVNKINEIIDKIEE